MSWRAKSGSLSAGINLAVFQFSGQLTLEQEREKEELLRAEEKKNEELMVEEERKAAQLIRDEESKKERLKEEEQQREMFEAQENQRLDIIAEEEAKMNTLLEIEERRKEAIRVEEKEREDTIRREQEAFALLKLQLQTIEINSHSLGIITEKETFSSKTAQAKNIESPALTYDPPGSNQFGKPSLWRVELAEDLRRKYEEFERGKREQDLFKRFDAFHERQQTEKEERKRLREELEKRLEEQRKIESEREKNRREQFRELYSERER